MNRRPVSVMVIGVGNDLRADDAAGLEVARRLRDEPGIAVNVHGGEAIDLLELWSGTDAVVLVDTMRTGEATGTIHRFDATSNPVPLPLRGCSSHAIGVAEAIELARTLGSLPQHVIVYGIEGARFALASELSDEVEQTIDPLADAVREEARALRARARLVQDSWPDYRRSSAARRDAKSRNRPETLGFRTLCSLCAVCLQALGRATCVGACRRRGRVERGSARIR
ncbi:MAG TPA: hydrogenase maturation protease [Solirubrobacteraceae bacterium]|nr:hydrogenase maturation protease [Solirubrobacteraceae bacterium]